MTSYELRSLEDCRIVLIALSQLSNRQVVLDRRIKDRAKTMKQALRNIIRSDWTARRSTNSQKKTQHGLPGRTVSAPRSDKKDSASSQKKTQHNAQVSIKRRTTGYKDGAKIDATFWTDGTVTVNDSTTSSTTIYASAASYKRSRHHTSGGRRHA